jgi:chemosensory pili system protein ChpA (sensor histidine kinase/response regulator)
VDGLLGNRQVVVKSVGSQLASIRWFTGATILADGSVALILDVDSLVRIDAARQVAPAQGYVAPAASKAVTVMVVDDSITVRKVTSRLLERHNMQVVTAKDGVDAVAKLQEVNPDVMLLDIEMPRMDGFELARHMQNSPDLAHVPIVMITSRTGDKHRDRALELGVSRYLGKPYQEAELLDNIYSVLAERSG